MTKLINTATNAVELTIDTVAPTNLSLGETPISADKRTTKEKPLTDAERIRRVVLPVGTWPEVTGTIAGAASEALGEILRRALREIAGARLRDYLSEQPMARTVALSDYTLPALLKWQEESAATRGALTFDRQQVEEWYPTSAIAAAMKARGQTYYDFMLQRLACLAAKNHGLSKPAEADKLLVLLEPDATALPAPAPLVLELLQRLSHISKQLTVRAAEKTVSIDDL